jgi:hypothetical protein
MTHHRLRLCYPTGSTDFQEWLTNWLQDQDTRDEGGGGGCAWRHRREHGPCSWDEQREAETVPDYVPDRGPNG